MLTKDSLLNLHRGKGYWTGIQSVWLDWTERPLLERRYVAWTKKSKYPRQVGEGSWIFGQLPSWTLCLPHPQLKRASFKWPDSCASNARFSMHGTMCVWSYKKTHTKGNKQRSMQFCRRPCSRRVCMCQRCGTGWNNTAELRGRPYLCLKPGVIRKKPCSSVAVFSSLVPQSVHPHTHHTPRVTNEIGSTKHWEGWQKYVA